MRKTPNVPYGSVGNGSSQHLAGALFEQLTGAKMQHVPYRITSQMQSDMIAGTVPVSFQLLPNVIGGIKGGQLRALAVAANKRLAAIPDVPTAAEAGLKGLRIRRVVRLPRAARHAQGRHRPAEQGSRRRRRRSGRAQPLHRLRRRCRSARRRKNFGRYISAEVVTLEGNHHRGGITLE